MPFLIAAAAAGLLIGLAYLLDVRREQKQRSKPGAFEILPKRPRNYTGGEEKE
jgi:hypothetical protein